MRSRRWIGILSAALLTMVVILGLAADRRAAAQTTTDATISITLESAMRRWMSEYQAGGRYYRDLETSVIVDTTPLGGMGTATTQRLWWHTQDGSTLPIVSETIYNWATVARAQQGYKQLLIDKGATPGSSFHGFASSTYYESGADLASRVWISGNLVFAVQEEHSVGTLGELLLTQGPPLEDYLYQEAVKNKLMLANGGQPAAGGQAPVQPPAAVLDTDQDGFPDSRDRCKTQPAPESADGCPDYSATIRCGPEEPEEGETIACTAEASGSPDGDTVEFEWEVDGKPQGTGVASQWKAGKSSHTVTVWAKGRPSGKQSTSTITILVRGAITKPVDDPSSNIVITNLGCSNDISSDESMDCLVGFKRLDSKIKELVVIWHVDGKRASTSTRMDDGDTYSLSQPAPGVHTIMVFVGDPNNAGRGRVMTTTARIIPGENARFPPGPAAGAAAGTLMGIGGWLWAQWWFAKQGSGPASPAIRKLPTGPRVDRSYSGSDAKTILEQLGIYNGLKRLDASDFTDPEFRARLEELLDTHFGKRKVKGIHYKVGADGEIDINSIEIVVEEPEDARHPRSMRAPTRAKPPAPKKPKPPVTTKPPVTQPPKTKPPVKIPPVDPKEVDLRQKWKDSQKNFRAEQKELGRIRNARNAAADEYNKSKARVGAEISTQSGKGAYDAAVNLVHTFLSLGAAGRLGPGWSLVLNPVINLLRQAGRDYIWGDQTSLGDHVWKATGLEAWQKAFTSLSRVPSGSIVDALKCAADVWEAGKKTKGALTGWGVVSRWANFYAEHWGRSKPLSAALDTMRRDQDVHVKLDDLLGAAKANRNSAKRHVQYAWDAYQEHLRQKRTAAR